MHTGSIRSSPAFRINRTASIRPRTDRGRLNSGSPGEQNDPRQCSRLWPDVYTIKRVMFSRSAQMIRLTLLSQFSEPGIGGDLITFKSFPVPHEPRGVRHCRGEAVSEEPIYNRPNPRVRQVELFQSVPKRPINPTIAQSERVSAAMMHQYLPFNCPWSHDIGHVVQCRAFDLYSNHLIGMRHRCAFFRIGHTLRGPA